MRCLLILLLTAVPLLAAEPFAKPRFVLMWGSKGDEPGEFNSPIGVGVGPGDEVFVTEFNGKRVQRFDGQGKPLGQFPVERPGAIAVDAQGQVYLAPLLLGKIMVFDRDGKLLREWGKVGTAEGEFKDPGGIAFGQDGSVYVADQSNHRVQRFTPEGKFLASWGKYGNETGEFGGKGKQNQRFGGPHFLAFDKDWCLYTTEGANGRIQKFTADGKFVLAWGDNSTNPGGFGGRPDDVPNPLPGPIGIGVDRKGQVWVGSTGNKVQLFTREGKYLGLVGEEGDKPGEFKLPHAFAVDSKGFVYVADASNQRIQKFEP